MTFTVDNRQPIASQLFAALRSAIVEVRLKPGIALSEKEISNQFGVSRQPVREAFIKLAEAGLVEVRPSRGTYVQKISIRAVAEARFVREAVECQLVRHAATLATQSHHDELNALVQAQRDAVAKEDVDTYEANDEAFHQVIADVVRCDFAERTVESARNQIDRVRFLTLPDITPMVRFIEQHQHIADAIAAKDPDTAERAMRTHLRQIITALPSIAQAHPDLFEDHELPEFAT